MPITVGEIIPILEAATHYLREEVPQVLPEVREVRSYMVSINFIENAINNLSRLEDEKYN